MVKGIVNSMERQGMNQDSVLELINDAVQCDFLGSALTEDL